MPDCPTIKSCIGRYFDGELSPLERHLVEDHLKQCSLCREDLLEIGKIAGVIQKGIMIPAVPSGLSQKIMQRAAAQVDNPLSRQGFFWLWRSWSFPMRLASVAVTAAACYIGLVLGSASLPSTRSPGDEMRWISMTSRGPIITAYVGSAR
jgi:anti-sigma factor RsiW